MANKNEMIRRIDAGEFTSLSSANIAIGRSKFRPSTKVELKARARERFEGKPREVTPPSESNGELHHRRAMTIALLYLDDRARKLTLDYLVAAKADSMSIDDMIREMSHSLEQLNAVTEV